MEKFYYPASESSNLRTQNLMRNNYLRSQKSFDRRGNWNDEDEHRHLRSQTDRDTETDTDRDDQWSRISVHQMLTQKNLRTFLPSPNNRWGDTSTVVTTSDGDESSIVNKSYDENRGYLLARYSGYIVIGFFAFVAFISPIIMVVLPQFRIHGWNPGQCDVDCESRLLSLSFRLLFLLIGSWAVFIRKQNSTTPRVFILRAVVTFLLFLVTFVFWLFYGMHIFKAQIDSYETIAVYAVAFVDVLLFLHYLAVILLEIRQLPSQFVVKIVRSPDSEAHSYAVGQMSLQHLAIWCLQQYYRDFQVYNPYLDCISRRKSSTTKFKIYNIDGNVSGGVLPDESPNVLLPGCSKESEHNKRFYDEQYNEFKIDRRKARLLVAVEEAFAQIERINGTDNRIVLDANQMAEAIFPLFGKALHKYLSATRQRPRYTKRDVLEHLALCISFDLKPRAFLNRYLTQGPVIWNDREYDQTQTWILRSNFPLNRSIQNETTFQLCQSNVSLLVTTRTLPHFNVTESADNSRFSRFILRFNSETKL